MELARVIGTVVSERKHPALVGIRLLVVRPEDANGQPEGEPFVCADALQAGVGDLISWVGGREAALTLPDTFAPVDAGVVSIVDHAHSDRRHL